MKKSSVMGKSQCCVTMNVHRMAVITNLDTIQYSNKIQYRESRNT